MKDVILEEILTLALEQLENKQEGLSDFDKGRMMAFYEILSTAKEQANLLGVKFDDERLNQANPEKLLASKKQAA